MRKFSSKTDLVLNGTTLISRAWKILSIYLEWVEFASYWAEIYSGNLWQ